jgi:two-component system sensor histidine kinase KdpD
MHGLSRQLATTRGTENILHIALKQLGEIFECQVAALLPGEDGRLKPVLSDLSGLSDGDKVKELNVAKWAFRTGQMAGWGTKNSPESSFFYIPLQATKDAIGVLALRLKDPATELWLLPEKMRLSLLESLTKQVALALEVERLEKAAIKVPTVLENGSPRAVS